MLRCSKCGHIHEAEVPTDPMKSDAAGWTDSDLNPPT
jgi:rubredoxin